MKRGLAVDHIDMDGVPAAYARTRGVAILLCGQLQCQRSSAAAGMSACSHEQALSTGLTMVASSGGFHASSHAVLVLQKGVQRACRSGRPSATGCNICGARGQVRSKPRNSSAS